MSARRRWLILGAAVAGETAAVWMRTGRPGGKIVVRCREGHLFTTLWIPGVSVKAARLGPWRFQRCPVGPHFSLVTPVAESTLSEDERRSASSHTDVRLP